MLLSPTFAVIRSTAATNGRTNKIVFYCAVIGITTFIAALFRAFAGSWHHLLQWVEQFPNLFFPFFSLTPGTHCRRPKLTCRNEKLNILFSFQITNRFSFFLNTRYIPCVAQGLYFFCLRLWRQRYIFMSIH